MIEGTGLAGAALIGFLAYQQWKEMIITAEAMAAAASAARRSAMATIGTLTQLTEQNRLLRSQLIWTEGAFVTIENVDHPYFSGSIDTTSPGQLEIFVINTGHQPATNLSDHPNRPLVIT